MRRHVHKSASERKHETEQGRRSKAERARVKKDTVKKEEGGGCI